MYPITSLEAFPSMRILGALPAVLNGHHRAIQRESKEFTEGVANRHGLVGDSIGFDRRP